MRGSISDQQTSASAQSSLSCPINILPQIQQAWHSDPLLSLSSPPPPSSATFVTTTNKRVLIILSTIPELYIMASNATEYATEYATAYTLLHRFESEKACHAIAKLDTHTSAVLTSRSIWRPEVQDCILSPGTSAIWKAYFSRSGTTTGDVVVEKLADFPNTGHLNKVATLPVPGADGTTRTSWP
jgi:hypothetical protein